MKKFLYSILLLFIELYHKIAQFNEQICAQMIKQLNLAGEPDVMIFLTICQNIISIDFSKENYAKLVKEDISLFHNTLLPSLSFISKYERQRLWR